MEKNAVFGELLYIGLVYEKGRCKSNGIWKRSYINSLKRHIEMLKKIAICMQNKIQIKEDNIFLKTVYHQIECDKELKGYYSLNKVLDKINSNENIITNCRNENKHIEVINLIIKMLEDILFELDKGVKKDKSKICKIIFSSHNLPRVFLNKKEKTLCSLGEYGITLNEALEYSKLSMDEDMLVDYKNLFIIT